MWAGEAGTASGQGSDLTTTLIDYFKPVVVGENPFNYRRIWEDMWLPKLVGTAGAVDAGDQRD